MKDKARHAKVSPPIACSLSEPDLAERRRELAGEVFRGALEVEDLEDGYKFVFPGSAGWATRLVEIINAERACCPFFTFELRFEPGGGPILLRVRGPEGTKELVATELAGPAIGPPTVNVAPEAPSAVGSLPHRNHPDC